MGGERSVTRWYIQRQIILNEISLLEKQLDYISPENLKTGVTADAKSAELLLQLARARERLSSQGPCPKPMMG